MRHGIAENYHDKGDRYRNLTAGGRIGVKKVSGMLNEHCASLGLNFTRVLHSPYVRTTQTAEVLIENIAGQDGQPLRVEPFDAIMSGSNVQTVIKECPESAPGEITLLITHQPLISMLIAELVMRDSNAANLFPMLPADARLLTGELFASGLMREDKYFSASSLF